jgi:hypothetical protein
VIPLTAKYHVGDFGIDTGMGVFKGVKDWERTCGEQVFLLHWVNDRLDYDIWELAGVPEPARLPRYYDCDKWIVGMDW